MLADPDTPFLHVGMNAPSTGKQGRRSKRRRWGVGVQNMSREYLPKGAHVSGDGLLRVQARGNYVCESMHHPLRDWLPHPGIPLPEGWVLPWI